MDARTAADNISSHQPNALKLCAGLVDNYNAAGFIAKDAGEVAACSMPPKL
jgi:hypothetical protein